MRRRDDLIVGPKEKAVKALKEGKKDEAIQYIEEIYQEFRPIHDRYGDWIQCLLNFIAERLGEDAVADALKKTFNEVYKARLISLKNMTHEELIKSRSQSHRTHFSNFYIEEDDEKTVLVINYCGSGGRIQKEGKLCGEGTTQAYPWSFDQIGVCYYCCHEAIFSMFYKELGLDFMKYEYHRQFDEEGRPTGKPCRWVIYKKKPTS
jgi:hypothetical protein